MSATDIQAGITNALPGLTASAALDINSSFLLQSGYLVFFMHCGFAMVRPAAHRSPLSGGWRKRVRFSHRAT